MAIGPHWPDPAKKIIQFPHRPRAHTPLGEAVSPTEILVWGRFGPINKLIVYQYVIWRATVDEDGHYCFAVAL